jgi:hypothetical protein
MEISSHLLKLSGKAELPKEIAPGHNYHISLSGSVPSVTETDNEDGTFTRTYTFKPIKIELLEPTGETLKLKDTRSKSQLFRAQVWKAWKDSPEDRTFDEYYEKLMQNLINFAPDIVQMYGPNKT